MGRGRSTNDMERMHINCLLPIIDPGGPENYAALLSPCEVRGATSNNKDCEASDGSAFLVGGGWANLVVQRHRRGR